MSLADLPVEHRPGLPGFVYALLGILVPLFGRYAKRQRRKFDTYVSPA
jgi:hypothetical protein